MDPRTRWQTLQAYLAEANAQLAQGAPSRALPLVEAALDLDPEFLAARDLRDSIIRNSTEEFPAERRAAFRPVPVKPVAQPTPATPFTEATPSNPSTMSAPSAHESTRDLWLRPQAELADTVDLLASNDAPKRMPDAAATAPVVPPLTSPVASQAISPAVVPAAPAAIEARARQRRAAHCIEIGRKMMAQGLLPAARLALEEARGLEPLSTDVAHLLEDLHELEQGQRGGPWRHRAKVAAAALLAVGLSLVLNRDAALDFLAREARNASVEAAALMNLPLTETVATTGAVDAPIVALDAAGAVPVDSRTMVAHPDAVAANTPTTTDGRGVVMELSTSGRLGAPIATKTRIAALPPITDTDTPATRTGPATEPPDAPLGGSLPLPGAVTPPPPVAPRLADDSPVVNYAPSSLASPTAGPAANTAATAANTASNVASNAAIPDRPADDDRQVLEVLQRYRAAYDALDAASAHAVWPSVDTAALARAFGDLSSQQLRFANCGVDVRGGVAQATCSGTARYVPRVGGRQPREEARTWTFALRKNGPQWVIESARVRPR